MAENAESVDETFRPQTYSPVHTFLCAVIEVQFIFREIESVSFNFLINPLFDTCSIHQVLRVCTTHQIVSFTMDSHVRY